MLKLITLSTPLNKHWKLRKEKISIIKVAFKARVGEEMIINWNEIKFQKGIETILKM